MRLHMVLGKRFKPILLSLLAVVSLLGGATQATGSKLGPAPKTVKVGGKWRIAWDVRLGTVRGILVLKQSATQVSGTFQEYGHEYPLSGNIQGQAITFEVPFSGPSSYTIEFRGTVDRGKMTGTSALKGGGSVFLGHAGEVDQPQRPWTATKGLKRRNDHPDKPPDDDDDEVRR